MPHGARSSFRHDVRLVFRSTKRLLRACCGATCRAVSILHRNNLFASGLVAAACAVLAAVFRSRPRSMISLPTVQSGRPRNAVPGPDQFSYRVRRITSSEQDQGAFFCSRIQWSTTMMSVSDQLLARHSALVHSEKRKVVSHVQREAGERFINTCIDRGSSRLLPPDNGRSRSKTRAATLCPDRTFRYTLNFPRIAVATLPAGEFLPIDTAIGSLLNSHGIGDTQFLRFSCKTFRVTL